MNDPVPLTLQDPSVRKDHLLDQESLANKAAADALLLIFRRIGTGEVLELLVSSQESVEAVRRKLAAAVTRSYSSPSGQASILTEQHVVQMVYGGHCLRDSERIFDVVSRRGSSALCHIYFSISTRHPDEQEVAPSALSGSASSNVSSSRAPISPLPISPSSLSAALRWLEVCDPRVHAPQAKRVQDVLAVYGVDAPTEWVPSLETTGSHYIDSLDATERLQDVPPLSPPEPQTTTGTAAGVGEAAAEEPEPPMPRPNWLDLYIIPNILFGLYLFGEKLSLPMQVGVGVTYYLFHTGIMTFIATYLFRRYIKRSTRFRRIANFLESGAGVASGGMYSMTATPRSPGIIFDMVALFGAFFFCLIPSYYPHASPVDPTPVTDAMTTDTPGSSATTTPEGGGADESSVLSPPHPGTEEEATGAEHATDGAGIPTAQQRQSREAVEDEDAA